MIKANNNPFDVTSDTQEIYRKLLGGMARPGSIQSIQKSAQKLSAISKEGASLLAIALTLLDKEASFHFMTNDKEEWNHYIKWQTFSEPETIQQADYLFVNQLLNEAEIAQLLQKVKKGSLEEPYNSATLIIRVDNISSNKSNGNILKLSGPGINGSSICYMNGISNSWFTFRESLNSEYPMGVDFIFTTESGEFIAIPRTTVVETEGV
ncbi:phosphonate C-P lyase system protein PhnH [Gracilibacillus sp. YIM 98692]|uniref:phosphonate C-P lyase system protein PhnH n=1 Tax=Gracilibacillus sp. YIM 98692 TaxID=2663532 RepID=UPI0013D8B5D5|nr:phosphonate C-P lyase system protein PhnH [Gracilibacillus sp. YIM 98692]